MAINSLHAAGKPVTLGELKHTQQVRKKRHRAGWLISILFLLLSAGIWIIYQMLPVSGEAQILREQAEARTPAAAEVLWSAPLGPVKAGQKVATLLVRHGQDLAFEAILRQAEDKRAGALRERNESEKQIANIELELDKLKSTLANAELEYQSAHLQLKKSQNTLAYEQKRSAKAERLWNLDAIKRTELDSIQRALAIAQHELKAAELATAGKQAKLRQEDNRQLILTRRLKQEQSRGEATNNDVEQYQERFSRSFGNIRETEKGFTIDLCAPADGMIENIAALPGSYLEADSAAVTIMRPDSAMLSAYVDPHDRYAIHSGEDVLVKFHNVRFHAKVIRINTLLSPLPGALKNEKNNPHKLYLKVILDTKTIPPGVLSGELGRAIFY